MFDRVACAGTRVEELGQVDLATLSALASLVSDALGKAPATCAGWVSDDQDPITYDTRLSTPVEESAKGRRKRLPPGLVC